MTTIREALKQFLDETGEGNRRSMSSPFMVIDLFGRYIDGYGHEDLNEFEKARFDGAWSDTNQFCDIFGPEHIHPSHINFFLNFFVVRKVIGTKGFLKACGPVMGKLAYWLRAKEHWDEAAMQCYRELVGDRPGKDLVACDALVLALLEHVMPHSVDAIDDIPDRNYVDDQLTIKKVEPGKLTFAGLSPDKDIVLALPQSVTSKAQAGWSVTLELARMKGKWRILGVGNVYP